MSHFLDRLTFFSIASSTSLAMATASPPARNYWFSRQTGSNLRILMLHADQRGCGEGFSGGKTMRHEPRHTRIIAHAALTSGHRRGLLGVLLLAASLCGGATVALAQDGKAIFDAACAGCHRIGGGRLVGPDLAGINERRPEDWLIRFIKSPAAVADSGDKTAVALFDEYKMPMPDQTLSDAEIRATLAHIKATGGGAAAAQEAGKASAAAPAPPAREAQPGEVQLGEDLFEGRVRFANGGPSCNACHHVTSDALMGGGVLAAELTLVFSRLGQEGVRAIIGSSPFPVMQAAYVGKGFSDRETSALVAFLQKADQEHSRQMPKEWGWRVFSTGVGGVIVLAGIIGLAGRSRKKQCVNQDIYDRQVRSQ